MSAFDKNEIYAILPKDFGPIFDITVLEQTDSTNTRLKGLARCGAKEGTTIIALSQSAGRGRLGRSFYSPPGTGLYISVLLKPKLSAEKTVLLTPMVAVAAAKAIEKAFDKQCQIKWVNDIFIGGKKVCGILCEGGFSNADETNFVVVGAGINLCPPKDGFPSDIQSVAGTVLDEYVEEDLRPRLGAAFLEALFEEYEKLDNLNFLSEYRRRSNIVGKAVNVIKNGTSAPATALFIDDDCRLVVRYDDGKEERLLSGEVSIRLL